MTNSDIEIRNFNSFFDASPMPSAGLMSDEDISSSLQPLLQMARSGKVEAQLEASRMLCDLSMRDDIQQQLCDSGCLAVLVQVLLPSTICEQVSHHALLALANLSEAQSCQVRKDTIFVPLLKSRNFLTKCLNVSSLILTSTLTGSNDRRGCTSSSSNPRNRRSIQHIRSQSGISPHPCKPLISHGSSCYRGARR